MKLLIVNADDFGLTEGVNQGIHDAHRRGLVTSTSLLANGAAFQSAIALARHSPALGVGIHLNLTDGRPIAPPSEIPSLINAAQSFAAKPPQLVQQLLAGTAQLAHIEREFRAQIEHVLAAEIMPTHLDGHQHVQTWPSIFAITVKLALEYGIRGIRCSAERMVNLTSVLKTPSPARFLRQFAVARALALLAVGQRARARRAGLACPAYCYGITQTGLLDVNTLETILRSVPEGTSELMCHPGYLDRGLEAVQTRLHSQRQTEVDALTQPAITALAARLGLTLGTYRDIQVGRI
ncbi:MAG TPA: ChbG/HpnK family deacetylase [Nitrospira sp.]|nr:ChbG/HpnK family deacetylase [Nitrospira sp.]